MRKGGDSLFVVPAFKGLGKRFVSFSFAAPEAIESNERRVNRKSLRRTSPGN